MPFDSRVNCHVDQIEKEFCGAVRDISIMGLFMETAYCPNPGSRCNLDIVVESKHSRLRIENVNGIIIRNDSDGFAIHFDERLEWFAMVTLCSHKQRESVV